MPSGVIWGVAFFVAFVLFIIAVKIIEHFYPSDVNGKPRRQEKRRTLKVRLQNRWQTWSKKQYDDMLDDFYQDKNNMIIWVEDDPWMDAEDDLLIQLRRQQQLDDEAEAYLELRRRADEQQAAEIFNYVLEYPESPEATRHLEECLDEALESLEQVRRSMAYENSQLKLSSRGSLEESSATDRINGYKAERAELEKRVTLIHQALDSLPED